MKNNSLKRCIVSVLLTLSLVLSSILPAMPVSAADEDTEAPHVVFTAADGRETTVFEGETITLNELDEGVFSMTGFSQEEVKWACSETIVDGRESTKHNIIQAYTGDFQGSAGQGPYTAYVSDISSGKRLLTFTLATTPTNLEELKLYVDGQEAPSGQIFEGLGSTTHYLTVKGRVKGDTQFRDIPNRVLTVAADPTKYDETFDRVTWTFAVPGDNTITYTVKVTDVPDVSASLVAGSVHVPVTGITVRVPETWEIHAWNGIFGDYYVGVNEGNAADRYTVTVEPWDASNKEVVWEALTPEIAEFMSLHDNGIVPKKQGLARFRVYSAENPDIYQDVEINFVYKNPLKSAEIEEEITVEEGDSVNLSLQVTPANASEQRFTWTYSEEGIVNVADTVSNDPSSVLIEKTTTHTLSAKKIGTVTVTGVPYDTTAGCEPVVFRVTVVEKTVIEPEVDALTAAKNGISKGLSWLSSASVNSYGNEWNIITILRSGEYITAADKAAYLSSVATQAQKLTNPTDLARVILAIGALNADPTDIGGVNLVEKLYSYDKMENQLSNGPVWALIALDSKEYEIPSGAVCTREALIDLILSYVCADGGFGLYGNSSSSLDMTGMALTALAPYYRAGYPNVQKAVDGALGYLSEKMTDRCGFIEGGSENSCTAAQILTAISSLGIDTEKDERFSSGNKNIVTNLMSFASTSGGFKTYASEGDNVTNGLATYQTTYALAAYKRFRSGEPGLYEYSDAGVDNVFRISRSEVTINVGDTISLTALNYPDPDANRYAFWWDTQDSSVVALYSGHMTISQSVYGRAAGDATIVVTYNGYDAETDKNVTLKASCVVHVVDPSQQPEPDDTEKTVVVSVEKFTLGQGYLIEPIIVTIPGSWNAAKVLDKVLKDQGYNYEYTGSLESGFYLSAICDADDGGLDIPECISNMTDLQGNPIPNLPTNEKNTGNEDLPNLGEFDYYGQSGWMYSVNDEFPSVGFSEKMLEDGDCMRIQFTLAGLGADLGASGSDSGVKALEVGDKTALTVEMARINENLSAWYGAGGSADRYNYAMEILTKVNADQEEIDLARKVLKRQADVPEKEPAAREGTCGKDLTWKLDEEGTLTVQGTGDMTWTSGKEASWISYKDEIRSVVLDEGVTCIADYAWKDCSGLTAIHLPESLKVIGTGAFMNCRSLTAVTLPTGMEEIKALAFRGCDNLAKIVNRSELLVEAASPHHGYVAFYAEKVIDKKGTETGKAEDRTLDAVADLLLEDIEGNDSLSPVEKALLVHDRLINWCEFANADMNLNAKRYETNTAYGALVEQWAVCEGYAHAYMVLMNRLGIETTVCESPALGHVWNIVTINGVRYHVDCTWDDGMLGTVKHRNLLLSSDGMAATGHTKSDWNTDPDDKRYEDYIWRDASSSFELYQGKIYYVDSEGYICSWKNNYALRLAQIPEFSGVTGLGANADGLYVSSGNSLFRFVPETAEFQLLYRLDRVGSWTGFDLAEIRIFGFKLEKEAFYLAIGPSAEAAAEDKGLIKISYDSVKEGMEKPKDPVFAIVKQPQKQTAGLGAVISYEIEVTGPNGISYQWQYSKDGGKKWYKSAASDATESVLTLKVTSSTQNSLYRCKVTAPDGKVLISESAGVCVPQPAVITANPRSVIADKGDMVTFKVEAEHAVAYQWYYTKDGSKWYKSGAEGADTAEFTIKVAASNVSNVYRCKITGEDGRAVVSESAGITVPQPAVIITQPSDSEAAMGETASFTVEAEHAAAYQWYYSKDGSKWYKSGAEGADSAALTLKRSGTSSANSYRCKITGEDGSVVYTDVVRFK